jgi:EAL domain-containing protein (putative c-di-GMP-specific phosphodiesterase class I)/FixJ family two-component response regulator
MTDNTILAIDDDELICELISATAEAKGLRCTATTEPAVFLNAINADTSLIMIDLMMPNVDGIELLRQLGKQQCKVEIVLISGVGTRILETARELAQAHGLSAVRHLKKPFRIAELGELLESHMRAPIAPVSRLKSESVIEDAELRAAIESDQFVLHYQPQIDIASGNVVGLEALVRWQHPEHGLIFPDRFIGRLEELGLIDQLGWIVARRGLAETSGLGRENGSRPTLSLNASASSLSDLTFPDKMAVLIAEYGISPERVILEITESALLQDLAHTLDVLTRLRMKQMQLSIDDFGTGYSMMQHLRNIPATELKIEKAFVRRMHDTASDRVVVRKTIEIGHELGMKVVAEGVETEEQLEFLRANGCDIAQGYLFSRPLPVMDSFKWLASYRSRLSAAKDAPIANA